MRSSIVWKGKFAATTLALKSRRDSMPLSRDPEDGHSFLQHLQLFAHFAVLLRLRGFILQEWSRLDFRFIKKEVQIQLPLFYTCCWRQTLVYEGRIRRHQHSWYIRLGNSRQLYTFEVGAKVNNFKQTTKFQRAYEFKIFDFSKHILFRMLKKIPPFFQQICLL